jgi:biopolymer transport protein ExbB
MLEFLSEAWPTVILIVVVINTIVWAWVLRRSNQVKKRLSALLSNLVGPFSRQSDLDPTAPLDEQIDAFIADIRDVLQNPREEKEQQQLYSRLINKDGSRVYLRLHQIEIWYSFARALIEVYPLLGIIGTVFAIWAGLNASTGSDADKITRVVQNFGESVHSTAYGLISAIIFLVLNSLVEPGLERLFAYGAAVRDIVGLAKQKMGMQSSSSVQESA